MTKQDRATVTESVKTTENALEAVKGEYHSLTDDYQTAKGRLFTRFALLVFQGSEAVTTLGRDWKVWAGKASQGFGSKQDDGTYGAIGTPSLYRYRNAGEVVSVLGELAGTMASYLAYVPLYRFLAEAKTEDERAAAIATIQQVWTETTEASQFGYPTEEAVRIAAEAVKPEGTRGSTGKTAAQRKAAKAKAAKAAKAARNTPTETTENDGTGNVEAVTIDPAAVEAVSKIAATMIRKFVRDGSQESVVRGIMLATIRLVREHGADTVAATLAGGSK